MLDLLHDERFVDLSPGEVYTILLDEDRYLCSESTMYRLLRQVEWVAETASRRGTVTGTYSVDEGRHLRSAGEG